MTLVLVRFVLFCWLLWDFISNYVAMECHDMIWLAIMSSYLFIYHDMEVDEDPTQSNAGLMALWK
jgi:hypothetical protein